MKRSFSRTLVATATAVAVTFSALPAAQAQGLDDLKDKIVDGIAGDLANQVKPKDDKMARILTALSSDGKEKPVAGQVLDILSSEDPTKEGTDSKKPESDPNLTSSENIAYGIFQKGFSDTTDEAAKSLAILLDAGLALGIIGALLVLINTAASLVTIGQALPSFGL